MAQEVEVATSLGNFSLELYTGHAPKTCYNFLELSKIGYYDGTKIHRLIRNFMFQGGDPSGTGRGGESIFGGKFEDEISPELHFTGAGILAMANSGPNSNGSQFFVTLAPCTHLDGKYTIFGRVCSGMKIVQKIGSIGTNSEDLPESVIEIHSIRPRGQ